MRTFATTLALLSLSGPVLACPLTVGHCVPSYTPSVVVVKKPVVAVVEPVYLATFLAVPVYPTITYPVFSVGAVGYTPPFYGPAGVGQPPVFNGVQPNGIQAAPQPQGSIPPQARQNQPPPQSNAAEANPAPRNGNAGGNLQALFQNRCASCHQGDATAVASGGGQVLLEDDGSVSRLSPAELTMVAFYTQGKTPNGHSCPPKNPLPKSEMDFIAGETERLRTQYKQQAKEALNRPQQNKPAPPKE